MNPNKLNLVETLEPSRSLFRNGAVWQNNLK
jgi:hypothetical protein